MQTALTSECKTRTGAESAKFTKRIGSTVYAVSVHFSTSSKATIGDKILRLMEREAKKTA